MPPSAAYVRREGSGGAVRVVLPEALHETVEGDVVGGDRAGLLALLHHHRIRGLRTVADGGLHRLPAVLVDQPPQLLELRVVTPSRHADTVASGLSRPAATARGCWDGPS